MTQLWRVGTTPTLKLRVKKFGTQNGTHDKTLVIIPLEITPMLRWSFVDP